MIVKNVSGETRYFGFVSRGHVGPNYVRGRSLANNATATLPDNDADTLAKVQQYVAAGVLQIVSGPASAAVEGSVNSPAAGWVSITTGGTSSGDTVTIAGQVFKWAADPGSGVLGTFYASLNARWAGANSATLATAAGTFVTAVNNAKIGVVADPATLIGTPIYVPLRAANGVIDNTGLTLVKSGANIAVSGATFAAGNNGVNRQQAIISYTAVAGDVSAGFVLIPTALPNIGTVTVKVITSAGAVKAWDGAATIIGSTVEVDNSGSTDFAATDVITVHAESQ